MLRINLVWDAKALAAPQSFRDGVQNAADILQGAIDDPITVNIEVGYGEYDLNGADYTQLDQGYSLGGIEDSIPISYPALRAALAAKASTANDVQAVAALPDTASLDGQSTFYIASALAKAFGAIAPTAAAIDGYIGFPTSFTGTGLIGTAITEELHAAGLLNQAGDLGLFSYTAPGNHFLPTGATSSTSAYFSLDGGQTDLANYAVSQDDTLFQGAPHDPLDFPNQGTAFTPLDLEEISAIGYDDTSTPVLPTPEVTATNTAPGTAPAIAVHGVSVPQNHSVTAASMIGSVSMPGTDSISAFAFYDEGHGNGHFALDGVAEPDGQYIFVLATQLDALTYVGGATTGSEQIAVAALDYASGQYSPVAQLTATTTQATAASIPQSDFNGDGTSDLLFQDVDGSVVDWLMTGDRIGSASDLGPAGAGWHAVTTGDFNGDGESDILFQNDDGRVGVWTVDGPSVAATTTVANPGPGWHAIGAGDFNGDGTSDILLQGDDGSVVIWTMHGAAVTGGVVVAGPGPTWHVAGTGDFDGDGKSDIVLQNDDGSVVVWTMNGTAIRSAGQVAKPGPAWHVAGTGDFDGDGKSDILLQADDGTVAVWMMNGTAIRAAGIVGNPGPGWHAVGTGDFDGSGRSGIALQNDNGSVVLWNMSGNAVTGAGLVADPGPSWQMIGQGGMHFIDATQTAGTVDGTVLSDKFVFTSFLPGTHAIAGFDPLHDVVMLDGGAFPNYAAVQAHTTQMPGGMVIDLGGGSSLTLAGIAATALSAKNFV